ncbi:ribonuclease H, partial [Trifolium pratense]
MARIGGIQRSLQDGNNRAGLRRLEQKLQEELNLILGKEELMWYQRSRAKWLKDGDRNTKYYHLKTVNRRRKNNVIMLKNDSGQWVDDVVQLQNLATEFYVKLFSEDQMHRAWHNTEISYPTMDPMVMSNLAAPITMEEVKCAVFNMQPWKAPGPDGFSAGFYQKTWNIVGDTVYKFVENVWQNPSVIADVNKTDICLIPKVQNPEYIQHFRPISLCNTSYKIVSKVIVERLKGCIASLISPYQTGFVPGRNIHENIVVAKEMAHTMHRMKGRKGAFAIKVDLAKAYDKLSWSFIWRTLVEINFPEVLINVIMHCVTSVMTNVKWNGTRTDFFRPQRGIRQGDPISPYLFVLCMDKLSHIILHAVEKDNWKGIKMGRRGPMISHLMFADDLLLFGEASEPQMRCVMDSLQRFCTMSGQEVSHNKTSVLFSRNVERNLRNKLLNISGFNETSNFGKYLGVPLHGRAPRRSDFQYLLDQVSAKLSMWKANHLSFAGRVTLAKSVIEAVPIYPMMSSLIPKACLEEIHKMQRRFIWGDTDQKRRFHAISWDRITVPKWMGGLGLRKLDVMNKACLLKLGWKVQNGSDELWCKVLRGKYGSETTMGSNTSTSRVTHSSLCKALDGLKP